MATALVVLIDGFEETEALGTVDVLRRAGMDVTTVSLTTSTIVVGAHEVPVVADAMLEEVSLLEADVLVIPGGTTAYNDHDGLKEAVAQRAAAGKYLAAICAAPMVLGGLGLLRGKNATCYPGFEQYCEGATVHEVPTVVDGTIITGRGPGFALEFGLAIVGELVSPEVAAQVRAGLLLA